MRSVITELYTPNPVDQAIIVGQGGDASYDAIAFNSENIIHDASNMKYVLLHNMRRLYESMVRVDVTVDGEPYSYEVARLSQGDGKDQEMAISSFSSSMDNPGNAFEIALRAAMNPDRSYTYVASAGNGVTSALSNRRHSVSYYDGSELHREKELRYYATHGSMLIHEDGARPRPLPVIRGLDLALKELGITPNRGRGDSGGNIPLGAHLAAFGENVDSVDLNVRTNIADRTLWQLGYGMLYVESQKNGPHHTEHTADPLSVPLWDELSRQVKEEFYPADLQPQKSGAMLIANIRGFTRGPNAGDPLMQDMTALLRRNPDANLLFTNGRDDPLHSGTDIDGRMRSIVTDLSAETSGKVTAAIVDDVGHGLHTFYPQLVEAISKAA